MELPNRIVTIHTQSGDIVNDIQNIRIENSKLYGTETHFGPEQEIGPLLLEPQYIWPFIASSIVSHAYYHRLNLMLDNEHAPINEYYEGNYNQTDVSGIYSAILNLRQQPNFTGYYPHLGFEATNIYLIANPNALNLEYLKELLSANQ